MIVHHTVNSLIPNHRLVERFHFPDDVPSKPHVLLALAERANVETYALTPFQESEVQADTNQKDPVNSIYR